MPRRSRNARWRAFTKHLPANLLWTQVKNHLEFPVLSDVGDEVAREFGLFTQVSDRLREVYYDLFCHHLEDANGPSGKLPVPGTFFVDSNATIRLAHVDVDHTRRLKADEIIETLTKPTPDRVRQTQSVFSYRSVSYSEIDETLGPPLVRSR